MTGTMITQTTTSKRRSNTSSSSDATGGRRWLFEAAAFVTLVGCGVALRLVFRDLPNFAPVAALALFAGYFFRSGLMALCVPLSVMAISDTVLGGYSWQMMAIVYGMLAVPVAMRGWLRKTLVLRRGGMAEAMAPLVGLVTCGLAASVLFFAVTNLGVWLLFGSYPPTLTGLSQCYVAAIPFFRYTLTGDLFFSFVLFGSYALALNLGGSRAVANAT